MPNMELWGYEEEMASWLEREIIGVMQSLDLTEEAIVTIVPAKTKRCNERGDKAPFLRLYHSGPKPDDPNPVTSQQIIEALRANGVNEDVEVPVPIVFYPKVEPGGGDGEA